MAPTRTRNPDHHNRQEARLQARQASRAQGEALKDPKESVGLFWSQLRDTHDGEHFVVASFSRVLCLMVQAHLPTRRALFFSFWLQR